MSFIPDNFKQIVPSIGDWVEHLSTDPLAIALQNMFAQIEVFHILGLFALASAVILVSLRLLGVGLVEAAPSSIYRNTRLWLHLGVVVAIASGLLMGLSNAGKLYDNSAFLWKMIALVAAVIFSYAVLVPVAKADGRVSPGAKAGLLVGGLVWLLSIVVMLAKQGANVGVFHLIFAASLIGAAAIAGSLRWVLLAGLAILVVGLQIATHGMIGDPFTTEWTNVNKVFMWVTGLFVLAVVAANILGRNAQGDSTRLTRLVGYMAILIWVTVGAGGRWIGLT